MNKNISKKTALKTKIGTICRFAPSPTGFLHVGNIRAAIVNYLFAIKNNGSFLLRFDDTDLKRTKQEYKEIILEDLKWLDINHESPISQNHRLDIYKKYQDKLLLEGKLYECFESDEELKFQRKIQVASGLRPIYNRSALNLTSEQKENYISRGLKPYYRFLIDEEIVEWNDGIKGNIKFSGRHFSDPVLIRADGSPTYTFCSVVDDIEFGITNIIRGEDHITNTAVQIKIFEAFGAKLPNFAHLALIKANDGKISKRIGGFDIKNLREGNLEPMTIINLLAQMGTSNDIQTYRNIEDLAENFDLTKFSKSATKYNFDEVLTLNEKVLQNSTFNYISKRLENLDCNFKITEDFWLKIRANISNLSEIECWWKICKTKIRYKNIREDHLFLKESSQLLPQDLNSDNSWNDWIQSIKKSSDRKGKDLFMPLRKAITGVEHGPELKCIITLIDRDEIINRLCSL
jgi:glutamyl-tRNA synthetase